MSEAIKLSKRCGKVTAKASKAYQDYKNTGNEKSKIRANALYAEASALKLAIQNQPPINKTTDIKFESSKQFNNQFFSNNQIGASKSTKQPKSKK